MTEHTEGNPLLERATTGEPLRRVFRVAAVGKCLRDKRCTLDGKRGARAASPPTTLKTPFQTLEGNMSKEELCHQEELAFLFPRPASLCNQEHLGAVTSPVPGDRDVGPPHRVGVPCTTDAA